MKNKLKGVIGNDFKSPFSNHLVFPKVIFDGANKKDSVIISILELHLKEILRSNQGFKLKTWGNPVISENGSYTYHVEIEKSK